MQSPDARTLLVITVNLLVSDEPGGLCSMPSRAGAPSSIPTHCQRDQEREAHARSSRRDPEAACSAKTGVKTHPQHSSNDTTACWALQLSAEYVITISPPACLRWSSTPAVAV